MQRQTVKIWCDGLEREMWKGRYPQQVVAGKYYNLYALIDYLTYKDRLEDKNLRKTVPEFDPIPIARLCGQEGVQF